MQQADSKSYVVLLLVVMCLAALTVACGGGGADDRASVGAGNDDDDDAADDDTPPLVGDDDDAADDDDNDTAGDDDDNDTAGDDDTFINVEDREEFGADWDCADAASCTADYLRFLDLAAEFAEPTDEETLAQLLYDVGWETPYAEPLPFDQLRAEVIDATNIDFLLDGLNARLLEAVFTQSEETSHGRLERFLFVDPWVGTFKGLLALPEGDPQRVLLAMHGHAQTGDEYYRSYPIDELVQRGFAVLMLTMRAKGGDGDEEAVTRNLLLDGFTFMGLRVYETLLGRKFLRHRFGQNIPMALIGHSGGSVSNNLVIRIDDGFAADITDCTSTYLAPWDVPISDEVAPYLYVYHGLIKIFDTAAVPVLEVPYEYEDGWDGIYAFLDQHVY